jgi:hypothetical protein
LVTTWIALAAAALTAGPAIAQQSSGPFFRSPIDCAAWVAMRADGDANSAESYVVGLINGLIWARSVNFWRMDQDDVRPEQVFLAVDNACRADPMRPIEEQVLIIVAKRVGVEQMRN